VGNRNRTPLNMLVMFFIFLFFRFVIKKNFCKAITLCFIKRNHVSIRNWIQKYLPKKLLSSTKRKIDKYIVDETMVKIGSELVWLWVVIETKNKKVLSMTISKEKNMLVAKRFLSKVIGEHCKHSSTEMVKEHGVFTSIISLLESKASFTFLF